MFAKRICVLSLGVVVGFCLSHCGTVDPGAIASASSADLIGYDLGVSKGKADGNGGLSRSPERYESLFSEADRVDFFSGYEDGYNQGIKNSQSGVTSNGASFGQPLKATKGKGTVTIVEGKKTVSVCHATLPNIEEARFIQEQAQIVVKSRGNHGPATVQLFDTRSGSELGKVLAYEIEGGEPAWAAGMRD